MGEIDQICRGHLSEQYFKLKQGGQTIRRGEPLTEVAMINRSAG